MEAMITPQVDSAQLILMVVAAASAVGPEALAQEEQAGEVVVGHLFLPAAVADLAFLADQVEDHQMGQEEEVGDHPMDREASARTDPEGPEGRADQEAQEAPVVEEAGHSSILATAIPTTGTLTEKCRRISCRGMAGGRRTKPSGI